MLAIELNKSCEERLKPATKKWHYLIRCFLWQRLNRLDACDTGRDEIIKIVCRKDSTHSGGEPERTLELKNQGKTDRGTLESIICNDSLYAERDEEADVLLYEAAVSN